MADTQRTSTDILSNLFQDGQTAGISAQDLRDFVVSARPDYAGLHFTTPAVTTITTAGTYVKAAGTTTLTGSSATMNNGATNNRLVYTGAATRHFHIVLQASVTLTSGTNQDIGLQMYKYDSSATSGALLTHSQARTTIPGTNIVQITSHADTMLDTDDYLEIHIANHTNTNNIQVDFGYMFCVSMMV